MNNIIHKDSCDECDDPSTRWLLLFPGIVNSAHSLCAFHADNFVSVILKIGTTYLDFSSKKELEVALVILS